MSRMRYALLVTAFMLFQAMPCQAAALKACPDSGTVRYEQLAVTSGVAVPISPHSYLSTPMARGALINVETASVRFRMDGTAPTTSTGQLLASGDWVVFSNPNNVSRAQFIASSTSATVTVQPLCD